MGFSGSSGKKDREDRGAVDLHDAHGGAELADLASFHTLAFTKDDERAADVAKHARRGEPLEDVQIAYKVSISIMAQLKKASTNREKRDLDVQVGRLSM